MAELLSTVLLTYSVFTISSWWINSLDQRWIVVAMGGAALPDLVKIDLLVDARVIEQTVGLPFSYTPVASIGGVAVVAGIVAMLFDPQWRRQAYATLLAAGSFSLLIDGVRIYADGYANYYLYPIWIRPPTPGLFVSADPAVLGVTYIVSLSVFSLNRWKDTD